MSHRNDHFADGAGMIDVFHGTSMAGAKEIKESGFSASYADSAHFVDRSKLHVARDYAGGEGGAVVHIRAPKHELDEHGDGYYGLPPDEEESQEHGYDAPGHLDASYVHCINGACTKR